MKTYLYNFDSEENSYLVSDYPWGFRLRTEQRYWIETKDKSNGGQRFCKQTKNPKTGFWCKPKKSVYYSVMVMGLDDKGYVDYEIIDHNSSYGIDGKEEMNSFILRHKENLTSYQEKALKEIKAYRQVMEGVSFKCEAKAPIDCSKLFSTDEKDKAEINDLIEADEKHKKEQEEVLKKINIAIGVTASRMEL